MEFLVISAEHTPVKMAKPTSTDERGRCTKAREVFLLRSRVRRLKSPRPRKAGLLLSMFAASSENNPFSSWTENPRIDAANLHPQTPGEYNRLTAFLTVLLLWNYLQSKPGHRNGDYRHTFNSLATCTSALPWPDTLK